MAFENDPARKGTKDTLAIAIYYIGPLLDGLNGANKKTLKLLNVENKKPVGSPIGAYEDVYEITPQGMPFNLGEYGAWIADTRESQAGKDFIQEQKDREVEDDNLVFKSRVHVISFDDFKGVTNNILTNHITATTKDFLDCELLKNKDHPEGRLNKDRLGRNNFSYMPQINTKLALQFLESSAE